MRPEENSQFRYIVKTIIFGANDDQVLIIIVYIRSVNISPKSYIVQCLLFDITVSYREIWRGRDMIRIKQTLVHITNASRNKIMSEGNF